VTSSNRPTQIKPLTRGPRQTRTTEQFVLNEKQPTLAHLRSLTELLLSNNASKRAPLLTEQRHIAAVVSISIGCLIGKA